METAGFELSGMTRTLGSSFLSKMLSSPSRLKILLEVQDMRVMRCGCFACFVSHVGRLSSGSGWSVLLFFLSVVHNKTSFRRPRVSLCDLRSHQSTNPSCETQPCFIFIQIHHQPNYQIRPVSIDKLARIFRNQILRPFRQLS